MLRIKRSVQAMFSQAGTRTAIPDLRLKEAGLVYVFVAFTIVHQMRRTTTRSTSVRFLSHNLPGRLELRRAVTSEACMRFGN